MSFFSIRRKVLLAMVIGRKMLSLLVQLKERIQYPSHTICTHCVAEIALRHYFLPVKPVILWYPVTPAMGKPSFDEPECIKEVRILGFSFSFSTQFKLTRLSG